MHFKGITRTSSPVSMFCKISRQNNQRDGGRKEAYIGPCYLGMGQYQQTAYKQFPMPICSKIIASGFQGQLSKPFSVMQKAIWWRLKTICYIWRIIFMLKMFRCIQSLQLETSLESSCIIVIAFSSLETICNMT